MADPGNGIRHRLGHGLHRVGIGHVASEEFGIATGIVGRAKRTYESILDAAAQLLMEVGVERISTNLTAERAGVTVPALYRYFPNKYAVLYALGAKLMDRQNEVAQEWFNNNLDERDPGRLLEEIYPLLQATCDVTREQRAGLEISQCLRGHRALVDFSIVAVQFPEQFRQGHPPP